MYSMKSPDLCPCCSAKSYRACCADFLEENRQPTCAEELMRARYSAFALSNLEYITKTMSGLAAKDFNPAQAEANLGATQWLGLDVIKRYTNPKNPKQAHVEFRALYKSEGNHGIHHELSEFTKINNHWYYTDGITIKPSINVPCPCRSGKKFKHCHGKAIR